MRRMVRLAKALVSRRRGDLVALRLTERDRALVAWCPDDEVFTLCRELVLDRVYDADGEDPRAELGTVVDAGAHVGIFSLQAAQRAKRVVALEASQTNFDLLRLNVNRNGSRNVDARHCALWSSSTEGLRFATTDHSGGGRVVRTSEEDDLLVTAVRAVGLDDLVEELGHIDLLKVDIEGAEYEVFGACTKLEAISRIVGEMHLETAQDRGRLEVLVGQLEDSGFVVSLVTESELLAPRRIRRLWRNRSALSGHGVIKVLAAAYYLAPIAKPIRPAGATYELPILLAHR